MDDSVLYFPYIRIPRSPWFTRVLLYWNEVGSIVPSEYQRQRTRLGPYMHDLVDAGLVKEVVPSEHDSAVPEFRSAFLKLADENSCILEQRGRASGHHNTSRIHIEKMLGRYLAGDLVDRGLASPAEYPWWDVEETTANLFMGYLASVLGKLDSLRMCPITDQPRVLSVFSQTPQHILNKRSLVEQLRMAILTDILPSPDYAVPVEELLDFKQSHSDLLPRFRRHIETFIMDLSGIADAEERDYRMRVFREQSVEQVDEIVSKMNERRWRRIVFGDICGIVAAAIPGVASAATGNPVLSLAALPGLVHATYSAFQGKSRIQKEILSDPLAYAAYAGRRFPVQKKRRSEEDSDQNHEVPGTPNE